MKCVHSVCVCMCVFPSPGRRRTAEANEKWNVFLHARTGWVCDVSAGRSGDVSVCQMPESGEQGHLSCGGFDYVRDPSRRAVWSALTLSDRHSAFIMSPGLRCHTGRALTVSLTVAHTGLITLLLSYPASVSVRVKPRFCLWSHNCSHRLFWGPLLLITC